MSSCDFLAGWAGGAIGIIIGHPFDTVKVNQQTHGYGMNACIKEIYQNYGLKGYFRGMAFPLVASGTLNSVLFGVYGHTLEQLKFISGESENKKWKPSYNNCLLAGLIGGFVQLSIACPIDVVKIKLQTSGHTKLNGPIHVVRNILSTSGPLGFFQGLRIMAIRDVPASGIYMWSYAGISDTLQTWKFFENEAGVPNSYRTVLAGGLAGLISWWAIIPMDVIKSRIQADDATQPKYNSIGHCAKIIWKSHGMKGFLRGFLPLSIRAFPVNSATFLGYEWFDFICHYLYGSHEESRHCHQ